MCDDGKSEFACITFGSWIHRSGIFLSCTKGRNIYLVNVKGPSVCWLVSLFVMALWRVDVEVILQTERLNCLNSKPVSTDAL